MAGKKHAYNAEAVKKAADLCGSLAKLAIAVEAAYSSAFNWAHGKTAPRPLSCIKIEKATDGRVAREDIRPDFNWADYKQV